jgi:hypothetical protein
MLKVWEDGNERPLEGWDASGGGDVLMRGGEMMALTHPAEWLRCRVRTFAVDSYGLARPVIRFRGYEMALSFKRTSRMARMIPIRPRVPPASRMITETSPSTGFQTEKSESTVIIRSRDGWIHSWLMR